MGSLTRRVIAVSSFTLLVASSSVAVADDATAEHPLSSSKLALSDTKPNRRHVIFKGRFTPQGQMDNPSFAGSTLRISGTSATDGDSGVIALDAAKWHALGRPPGSGGYRYKDPSGSAGGVTFVMVKQGKRHGSFKVIGGKTNWTYAITGPQTGVTLKFTVGKGRWCAEFSGKDFAKNVARRVVAHSKTGPASCPCDRFTSTFEAIQSVIFERHQCNQAACHGSATPQGGLDLRPDVAYDNLVDVESHILPGAKRVDPGRASQDGGSSGSVLWRKLAKATNGVQDDQVGEPMPNGGLAPISASELEALRRWIHSGAPKTGVVIDTEQLLDSCLPPADPIDIRPPAPPPADVGIQLHAPPWDIPPKDPSIPGHDGEDEVCYATYYDFSNQVPAGALTPCPDFWGGPTKQCFFYNKSELTQEPNSHHSIIHLYKGVYDIADDIYTCRGGDHNRSACDPNGIGDSVRIADCGAGIQCARRGSAFGPFTCLGGAKAGQTCDPKDPNSCGPDGGCAGKVESTIACLNYGPPDYGNLDLDGAGTDNAPSIGGSQQPVSSNIYPPQVFTTLPVKGTIVWNSHAFNLTSQLASNQQWLNLYFAYGVDSSWHQVRGIFDSADIFVENVAPFQKHEYCRTITFQPGTRLFQFSSHTHKRGELFRIWGPGITDRCGTGAGRVPAGDCPSENSPPIFTTTLYSDPEVLYLDSVPLDGADAASRTYKFCSRYDNGADDPTEVKRQSTSPQAPIFGAFQAIVGGPCPNSNVACLDGAKKGQLCHGNNSECDSAPGLGDGVCDACPVHGGVTTEDEMFILLGFYYCAPNTPCETLPYD